MLFKRKKKEYKMPDSYALSVVRDVKASDQRAGYIRPPQYYDCYRKLLSDRFRKYKQADFELDVKRLGPGHYTKLKEVTLG